MINRIWASRYQKAIEIVGRLQDWIDQRYNPENNQAFKSDLPMVIMQIGRGGAFLNITINEVSLWHSEVDDAEALDFARLCNIWIKWVQRLAEGMKGL